MVISPQTTAKRHRGWGGGGPKAAGAGMNLRAPLIKKIKKKFCLSGQTNGWCTRAFEYAPLAARASLRLQFPAGPN